MWGRGCRLKVNVHVERLEGGGGLIICTLWMTPIITGFLNFIFDIFQAGHVFIAELTGKFVPFVCWKAKLPKKKPLSTIFDLFFKTEIYKINFKVYIV